MAPDRRLADVTVSDLLVVLILGLGVLRFVIPFFVGVMLGLHGASGLGRADGIVITVIAMVLQTVVLLAIITFFIVRRRGVSWRQLGFVPAPRGSVTRAILLAVATVPAAAVVNLAVQSLIGGPVSNPQIRALAPAGFSWGSYLVMLAMAGFIVPVVEELAFRGLLFGWLRTRYGFPAAAGISAAVFSVLHGVPYLIPALLVVGLMLAFVYEKSRSLWASIAFHGTFNAVMTTMLYAALRSGMQLP